MTRDAPPEESRVILIHSLDHAHAALAAASEADTPVVMLTAPGASAYAGSEYLKAIVEGAKESQPAARFEAVIDCGEDAGHAMGALRIGWKAVLFTGTAEIAAKLADIAGQQGARLLTEAPPGPTLDLLDTPDAASACRDFVAGKAG